MPPKNGKAVYGPDDLKDFDYLRELGNPGEFPYARGIHPEMYRARPWTIRQFAGHGLAFDTNARWKMLLKTGTTGLSTPFDLPTLMGLDSDDPLSFASVGWDGVAVDTIRDMEELFDGIDIDKITISMTASGSAAMILAMYAALAQKREIPLECLGGTIQNDILKEFVAQREWIYPVRQSMRLIGDTIEFCTRYMPKWNPISISGYHISEAGATAVQELSFTLADGIEYVREGTRRGLSVDEFAPRLSFFFNIHNNFFEEIAKLRAARKLWAHIMRDKFGAKNPRSEWCRMHVQTAGSSLTLEEPLNNIARVALQALAGALGGAQSMHTNSYDEVICTPTADAAKIAVRTQQILQTETGICDVVDALGGSYYLEKETQRIFEEAMAEIRRVEDMGGMAEAVQAGYPQRAIQESARIYENDFQKGDIAIVGKNKYVSDEKFEEPESVAGELEARRGFEPRQLERLRRFKEERLLKRGDNIFVAREALDELHRVAKTDKNLMPSLIRAASKGATLGEMVSALKDVWGPYKDCGLFMPSRLNEDLRRIAQNYRLQKPTRILLAKGGLDGHDRPIYTLAPFLRELGAEVIYPGLHLSCEALAKIALQENVDVVSVSTHIGDPVRIFEKLVGELKAIGHKHATVIGGGIIRLAEMDMLRNIGVEKFFPAIGAQYEPIAEFLKKREETGRGR